jgi:uncharacterized protein (DUF3084 family)
MPVFDENGKKVDVDSDFPKLKDLDDNPQSGKKKSFLNSISIPTIILAAVVVVLLIVAAILALKVNTLNEEITALSNVKKQLTTTQTKLDEAIAEKEKMKAELSLIKSDLETIKTQKDELDAQFQKLQEAAKKKPQPAAAPKKLNGQKKK